MSSGEFRIIIDFLEKEDPLMTVKDLIDKIYKDVIPF